MKYLEGSGTLVLYIGRKVLKGMIYTTCVLLTVISFECYTIYLPYHLFNNILISNIFNYLCKMALSHNRNSISLQQLQISRLQRSWMHIISIKLPRNWLVYRTVYPLESAYVNNLTRSPVQITLTLKAAAIAFNSSNTSLALLSHVRNKRDYNQDVWRNTGVWTCRIQPPLQCVAQAELLTAHSLSPTYGQREAWIITSFVYI
jgi:phage-related tail fiber protein